MKDSNQKIKNIMEDTNIKIQSETKKLFDEDKKINVSEEKSEIKNVIELVKENQELKNKNILLLADMENLRKRHKEDLVRLRNFFSRDLFRQLIPTIEMFESALNSKNVSEELKNWLKGFEMILKNINGVLENFGISKIDAKIGDHFNSNFHEALDKDFSDSFEEDKIIKIIQKGYSMNEELLIPTKVIVSKGKQNLGDIK